MNNFSFRNQNFWYIVKCFVLPKFLNLYFRRNLIVQNCNHISWYVFSNLKTYFIRFQAYAQKMCPLSSLLDSFISYLYLTDSTSLVAQISGNALQFWGHVDHWLRLEFSLRAIKYHFNECNSKNGPLFV